MNRLVENDEFFSIVSGKMSNRSSMLHIMVLLKYLGSYENDASLQKIGQMMGISKGAVNECVTHACSAILKLHDQVVKWPNEAERKNISA